MGPSVAVVTLLILLGAVSLVTAGKPKQRVHKTELSHPCSRALSRTVRQRFQAHVSRRLKAVQRLGVPMNWSDGCPFSPLVDIFGWHEKNKSRSKTGGAGGSRTAWVCNYTGKTFKNEHYIDLHMENHFMTEAPENGTCLADYCEVFGFCKVVEPAFLDSLSAEPPPCDPIALEAQKRTCQSVCDRCALLDDPGMPPDLNAHLHKSLCEPLTCEFRAEMHHSNRKWHIVGGISVSFVIICMFFCWACAPSPERTDRSWDRDRRYHHAGKRERVFAGSRERQPPRDNSDNLPTKPIKQE